MRRPSFTPCALWVGVLACAAAGAVNAQNNHTATSMVTAAKAFLASLDPDQKAKATFPFDSPERMNWYFVPRDDRKGVPLKAMNETQQKAALDLLRASLSPEGYKKAATIRSLENILKVQEMGKGPLRDPVNYYFTVFGEPSETGKWGWRYEGHHCSQNFTISNGKLANTPEFFGSNPAEVRIDVPDAPPRGTRVLAKEEDLARDLLKALNEDQRKKAILSETAPSDITTSNQRQVSINENKGLAISDMTDEQKEKLHAVGMAYLGNLPQDVQQEKLARIGEADPSHITFAWMGGTEPGQGHYYKIQGDTFLIEFDNTQNNANHVHSVWREFKGDWGMDILAMHYRMFPHRYASAK